MRSRLLALTVPLVCLASAQDKPATIADKVKGMKEHTGLFTTYIDSKAGKAFLKFPAPTQGNKLAEFIYVESLVTGVGSNDLGIDRTSFGNTYVVEAKAAGGKVLFQAPNLSYRAITDNPDEQRAVREGFATSVLWAGPIAAQDPSGEVLVDITDFLVNDAHTTARALGDGYSLDRNKSVLETDRFKAFPENLEFEALLTFASSRPNQAIGDHAPDSKAVTLSQRHSFVKLPEPGYKPREYDARSGSFSVEFLDFAAPLDAPLKKRWIERHRLEKVAENDNRVKEPIVYYVDRGVPEPIRTALIDGGNYWKTAFERAGFVDAFRVELMPEGMDPNDVRYNVIQWMNRSTRGWAYGQSVVDPRTGEIIKGAVNLDSQRARQDIMIFEALLGVDQTGKGGPNDPIQIALSRIRQLSGHEIGHTLGFMHNFGAGRASVMDYPAPVVQITPAGDLDLSNAYAQGVGAWDLLLVNYAYRQFASGENEKGSLAAILHEANKAGLVNLADNDASEGAGAHPGTNRWDTHADSVAGLRHSMRVRRIAMDRFSEKNVRIGRPLSDLELVFGPLYYFHRYDVDAAAKLIGGVYYTHVLVGETVPAQAPVPGDKQREAMQVLIQCLQPSFLAVPERLSALMGPVPPGYQGTGERFPRSAAFVFDSVAAASSGADLVLSRILSPQRCARVLEMSARDTSLPSLEEVFDGLLAGVVKNPTGSKMEHEIGWAVQNALATRLMDLATSNASSTGVRARAHATLTKMASMETRLANSDKTGNAANLAREINRFLSRPLQDANRPSGPLPAVPGSPIGD
jgi:hypothetical protein